MTRSDDSEAAGRTLRSSLPLLLVGFMGAGKSTVGRLLATGLGRVFLDLDDQVAAEVGRPVGEFLREHGERRFRQAESRALDRALRTRETVVAAGGGAVLSPGNRRRLVAARRAGTAVVWLRVSPGEALRRVRSEGGAARDRPLLPSSPAGVRCLVREREPLYRHVATAIVDTDGRRPEEVAGLALRGAVQAVREGPGSDPAAWPSGTSEAVLEGGPDGHGPVVIGSGLLARLADLPGFPRDTARRALLVAEPLSLALWGEPVSASLRRAGLNVDRFVLPAGERAKTPRWLERLWGAMAAARLARSDIVVSLGGGAVSDVAGLAAATYMRGLRVAHVPTTLLAQVDAAIGGKTAVNVAGAKNLAGVVHFPALVAADVACLRTLPPELVTEGLVELVKTLLVFGQPFPERMTPWPATLPPLLIQAVRAKLAIVRADPLDAGGRHRLNLGHTVGHALEAAAKPGRVRHGLAVGVGLVAALRLSVDRGTVSRGAAGALLDRLAPLVGSFRDGLRRAARLDPATVVAHLALDKKRTGEVPPFVLLREGQRSFEAIVVEGVAPGEVRAALAWALSWVASLRAGPDEKLREGEGGGGGRG